MHPRLRHAPALALDFARSLTPPPYPSPRVPPQRQRAQAAPYSLHAIFSHGKSAERKAQILREAGLWHDPPSYYAEGKFLQLAPEEEEADGAARARGGVELLTAQLVRFDRASSLPLPRTRIRTPTRSLPLIRTQVRFYQGLRLASLLNRTYVVPRLRCGEAPMAYPCYAWYHRAMTKDAKFNSLKVAMPHTCPTYYWLAGTAGHPV